MALDTFRRFQKHWKRNVILVYVMEVFFWLTQVFILYYVLFRINAGELRFYVFAACLLGFSAYQVFAKNLYKRLLERVIFIIASIYKFLYRLVKAIIFTPIKYITQLLVAVIIFLFNTTLLVVGFVLKCVYFPLKWIFIRIYRLLPKK
ncbi:spore cortex biosynthesis protein YabQ [Ornithinibacillus scapharcae]|uniref:spore cortex biosynthesis protein YabQ n=1 Tax=Ornithinibacillus scapharcae TaxID=1147159 RepID=UPI000225AAAD|nr:spore cortex biosynthesis protein YabQ [Ornithinibacillus scapharcae]